MQSPYKVLAMAMWFVNFKSAVIRILSVAELGYDYQKERSLLDTVCKRNIKSRRRVGRVRLQ